MEKLQSQRERRKRGRGQKQPSYSSGSHSFTHISSTYTTSSCYGPPACPPPCRGTGIFPQPEQAKPQPFPAGSNRMHSFTYGWPCSSWRKVFSISWSERPSPTLTCGQLSKAATAAEDPASGWHGWSTKPSTSPWSLHQRHSIGAVYALLSCPCWCMELPVALHTLGRADRLQMVPYRRVKSQLKKATGLIVKVRR